MLATVLSLCGVRLSAPALHSIGQPTGAPSSSMVGRGLAGRGACARCVLNRRSRTQRPVISRVVRGHPGRHVRCAAVGSTCPERQGGGRLRPPPWNERLLVVMRRASHRSGAPVMPFGAASVSRLSVIRWWHSVRRSYVPIGSPDPDPEHPSRVRIPHVPPPHGRRTRQSTCPSNRVSPTCSLTTTSTIGRLGPPVESGGVMIESSSYEERHARAADTFAVFVPGVDPERVSASLVRRLGLGGFAFDVVGEMWARPELSRRDRSLIVVSTLAAQARNEELELHTEIAIRNGLTREELEEIVVTVAALRVFRPRWRPSGGWTPVCVQPRASRS